jgi:hypothetical protein
MALAIEQWITSFSPLYEANCGVRKYPTAEEVQSRIGFSVRMILTITRLQRISAVNGKLYTIGEHECAKTEPTFLPG